MRSWYQYLRRLVAGAAAALPPRPGRRRATFRPKVEDLEERRVLSTGLVIFVPPPVEAGNQIKTITIQAHGNDLQGFRAFVDQGSPANPVTAQLNGVPGNPQVILRGGPGVHVIIELPRPIEFGEGQHTFQLRNVSQGSVALQGLPKLKVSLEVEPSLIVPLVPPKGHKKRHKRKGRHGHRPPRPHPNPPQPGTGLGQGFGFGGGGFGGFAGGIGSGVGGFGFGGSEVGGGMG
jgi:hypothetical protein